MADPTTPDVEEQARRRFVEDTAALMEDPAFRRWALYLIDNREWCKSDGLPSMSGAGLFENPLYTYFHEGRRSIGVALKVLIQRVAPKFWLQMLNEAMGLRNQQVSAPVQTQRTPSQG